MIASVVAGDYPSSDFEIDDEHNIRRVLHLPTGMLVETSRMQADPIAVPAAYTVKYANAVARPGEIAQAALRHLRVWLMRNNGKGGGPRAAIDGGRAAPGALWGPATERVSAIGDRSYQDPLPRERGKPTITAIARARRILRGGSAAAQTKLSP